MQNISRKAAAATLSAALLGACAGPVFAPVPAALEPAADESRTRVVAARGVQIYECRARKDGNGFEWAFVAPDAELFDLRGRPLGRHGAGPYWQASDGSRVVGTVKARADAPAGDAIPWLLLTTKSSGAVGAFSATTSIQRINTVGGVAPTSGCSADVKGASARVPYTADYVFFSAR
jgi:hypothetical protein